MFNFEDDIGLLALKTFTWKKTPVCEGSFQIWSFGMELWDKTFNSEDDIGLLVLKMINWKKWPLFVKELFQSDHLEQSYGTKYCILKIT